MDGLIILIVIAGIAFSIYHYQKAKKSGDDEGMRAAKSQGFGFIKGLAKGTAILWLIYLGLFLALILIVYIGKGGAS